MESRFSSRASVSAFIAGLADAHGGPAAPAAAAVAGAMGTSLLLMVAGLPARSTAIDGRMALIGVSKALDDLREHFIEAIDTDTDRKLGAARNLPHASPSQRAKREAAIQLALHAATGVPLEVLRLCARGLKHAQTVAAVTNRAAAADLELAIALLRAGFNGARANLETKLNSLTDDLYTRRVVDEIARLSDQAMVAAHAAEGLVQAPPA